MITRPPPLITAGTLLSALLIFTPNTTAQTSSPTLTTLATFASAPSDGIGPLGVVTGSGGVLYGVTQTGGATGSGTVFSLTPPASSGGAWTEAVLYNFTGGSDGGDPTGVVIGSGGVLYGTTTYGGSGCDLFLVNGGCGVVYSLTPPAPGPFGPGRTWTESVLYSFSGGNDGSGPTAGVAIGSGGVLYGTTSAGGTGSSGTVFSLTPPASPSGAWTEQVLYRFPANVSNYYGNSFSPNGVVIGSGGVLYGVTQYGGAGTNRPCNFPPGGCGTVYSLTPPKSPGGAWTAATLYNFSGGSDGAFPAGVAIGGGGVLYGTTQFGGPSNSGVVFSLTPQSGTSAWTETVLYSGGSTAGVAIGAGGVLYAVIQHSLPGSSPFAVVSLTPPTGTTSGSGGSWTASTLYTFSIPGGAQPVSALVVGSGGVLYGATLNGGTAAAGTIYSVTPPSGSGGAWTGSVLYSFTGGSAGSGALTGLAIGGNGVLYGATTGGGAGSCPRGCGTVFSLTPPPSAGGAWTESLLYRFAGGSDGAYPEAALVVGNNGVLYGTTYVGGTGPCTLYGYPPGCGTVFSLTPPASPGGAWTEAVLHSFAIPNSACDLPLCPGGSDGAYPNTDLAIGSGGVLYGTTQAGGTGACNFGCGTAFQLAPPMSPGGAWAEAVLYSFTNNPFGLGVGAGASGLAIGSGGMLYGTTQFTGISPIDGQVACGSVFSLAPPTGAPAGSGGAWTETALYNFAGVSDGCGPNAGVVIGGEGVLYGTTLYSGTGYGAVFSLTPPTLSGGDWTEAVTYNFTGAGGATPNGLTIGSGGVLYGSAQIGGSGPCTTSNSVTGCGTVFALVPPVPPDGAWVEATLYNFTGASDGAYPNTGVVIGSGGVLYGTTQASANTATVFSLTVGNGLLPAINSGGVVNAASYTAPVAPGSIASAFGDFLLPSPLSTTQSPLPTELSDLSLRFGDAALSPLFFVSGRQVNFQVPWEVAGSTTLTATVNGQTGAPQAVALAPFAPAVFSTNSQGSGQGAILDASNHLVNASNPATSGSTVQIFCTGLGAVTNQPPTGSPAPLASLVRTLTTPTATIGGLPANVSFAGLAPGYVGLYQVNAQVPAGLAANNAAPVVLYIGGATSNTVTMAVQ